MAKQTGAIIIEGTIDDITFYKMDGKGYARRKTSLTGKRVKRDPRFQRTMQSANRFGKGNQLASKVYRSLPKAEQVYGLFKELKSMAILAIKEGKEEAEVLALLQGRIKKSQDVKKNRIVAEQLPKPGNTNQVKKCPRLFRVYGDPAKTARAPHRKARRLRRADPPGTGQGDCHKRE